MYDNLMQHEHPYVMKQLCIVSVKKTCGFPVGANVFNNPQMIMELTERPFPPQIHK